MSSLTFPLHSETCAGAEETQSTSIQHEVATSELQLTFINNVSDSDPEAQKCLNFWTHLDALKDVHPATGHKLDKFCPSCSADCSVTGVSNESTSAGDSLPNACNEDLMKVLTTVRIPNQAVKYCSPSPNDSQRTSANHKWRNRKFQRDETHTKRCSEDVKGIQKEIDQFEKSMEWK